MKKLLILCSYLLFLVPELLSQPFTGSFDLVSTQQYPNGNTRNDTISYFLEKDRTAVIIHGRGNSPGMRMLFDYRAKTITNLFVINGKKGGYILPMDEAHWPGLAHVVIEEENSATGAVYSGREKNIQGYNCKEAIATNSEYDATLWLADDLELSMTSVLSYQSVGKGKSKKEIELFEQFGISSLPLEMFLKSKHEKPDVNISLKNIKTSVNQTVFSTEGYNPSKIE